MIRLVISLAIALLGLQALAQTPNLSACSDLVKLDQTSVTVAEEQFAVGEVTKIEVNQARLTLLNTQFNCRSILFGEYCKLAIPTAQDILTSVVEEERLGRREMSETKAANYELIRVKSLCL